MEVDAQRLEVLEGRHPFSQLVHACDWESAGEGKGFREKVGNGIASGGIPTNLSKHRNGEVVAYV